MPQTASKLLLAAILIAVGIGSLGYLGTHNGPGSSPSAMMSVYFSSFALIGAGIFVPFKRPLLGGFLGLIVAVVILIFIQSARERQPEPKKSSIDHSAAPWEGLSNELRCMRV